MKASNPEIYILTTFLFYFCDFFKNLLNSLHIIYTLNLPVIASKVPIVTICVYLLIINISFVICRNGYVLSHCKTSRV